MWEIFFLKNHTENVVGKLVSDPFIKNQNCISLKQQSEMLYSFVFVLCIYFKNEKNF